MPITLKYPGVTVLEMALSCPGSARTWPSTVKDRLGIPCKSTGTFVAMAAASTSGKERNRSSKRVANSHSNASSGFLPLKS